MKKESENSFCIDAPFKPAGDQPSAIKEITSGFKKGSKHQVLLGVTGSGKTFSMANVIQEMGVPTLIISHNKTLVAQLYQEFKSLFPTNAVEYFVSYYDYYQPEAYLPVTDTFIEKDSSINDEIEKLRLKTTASLLSRKDVIVVASVSCIFGLGSPEDYQKLMLEITPGLKMDRDDMLRGLVKIHYTRNDYDFKRGTFRVRGDVIDIHPAYDDFAIRVEMFGDSVERVSRIDLLSSKEQACLDKVYIYPARHFVTSEEDLSRITNSIQDELEERLDILKSENKLVEAQRLESRTRYDIEMIEETGFCSGIENYSRIVEGREPGTPPSTLIDFFKDDFLLILDESHATIPQVKGMFGGDRSRKQTLVDFGFRLPCAQDNRPLNFEEFEAKMPDTLFVSATPADYELNKVEGVVTEQVVRPTGLLDPLIEVRPVDGQIDDILNEVSIRIEKGERTLIVTLTKKSAEDLTDFLKSSGVKTQYMHSDTETFKRVEILSSLRKGEIDVLVGINLLREGLDLPEVSLILILDADKEGFLRNKRTLVQVIGRASRNVNGMVIMYGDKITDSMKYAIDETVRRRKVQEDYNKKNKIVPKTIIKEIREHISLMPEVENRVEQISEVHEKETGYLEKDFKILEQKMLEAADRLDFEEAARLRDKIKTLKG